MSGTKSIAGGAVQPKCSPRHLRYFSAERLRSAREAARLSVADVVARIREFDFADGDSETLTAAALAAYESGAIRAPAWFVFAVASVCGVAVESLGECVDCTAERLGVVRS